MNLNEVAVSVVNAALAYDPWPLLRGILAGAGFLLILIVVATSAPE